MKDVLCPQCGDQTIRVWYDPKARITKFQCKDKPKEHEFYLDNNGDLIEDECGFC